MKNALALVFLFLFPILVFALPKTTIDKANIIRGESFVTANSSAADIEKVVSQVLRDKQ